MSGTVDFVNQGAQGQACLTITDATAFQSQLDLGQLGMIRESFDGQRAWTKTSFSPFEELHGQRLDMARLRHPLWLLGDWQSCYENPDVLKSDELDDDPVWVVLFRGKDIPNRTLYVNQDSGLIVKEKTALLIPGIGQLPVELTFDDYRSVNGVMLPFYVAAENAASGQTVIQYEAAVSLDSPFDYELTAD